MLNQKSQGDATPARVTLITTVRDGASFLPECMESVQRQTRGDWIHLILDDGSCDGSAALAAELGADDPRVRVLTRPPRGRRASLQEAHNLTDTEFVGWVDVDDRLAPGALARALATMDEFPDCGMVFTDHRHIDSNGAYIRPRRMPREFSAEAMLTDFSTFHFRLIRESTFRRCGGIAPDTEIAIDYDLCLRLTEVSRVLRIAEPLYDYRLHRRQLSSQFRNEQAEASATAVRKALCRRGLQDRLRLDVSGDPARFQLKPIVQPRTPPGRLDRVRSIWSTVRRHCRAPTHRSPTSATLWPPVKDDFLRLAIEEGLHRNGIAAHRPNIDLTGLLRSLWLGERPELLVLHRLAPILVGHAPGQQSAVRELLVRGLDWMRAHGTRVIWFAWDDATAGRLDAATVASVASRCSAVVAPPNTTTFCDAAVASGAPLVCAAPPSLLELAPRASRCHARAHFGLGAATHVSVCLGKICDAAALRRTALRFLANAELSQHLLVVGPATTRAVARAVADGTPDAHNVHLVHHGWSLRQASLATAAADVVEIAEPCTSAWEVAAVVGTLARPLRAAGIEDSVVSSIPNGPDPATLIRDVIDAAYSAPR